MDRPAAIGQAEEAALGIGDLDMDTAPAGFLDDDHGVGIELRVNLRTGEQRLVYWDSCA